MNALRLALAALTTLLLIQAPPARALEQILDYAIEIGVRADGSLDVAEHITVNAEGRQIRRGIFRDFPTRYRDRHGNHVVVGLEVLSVERNGRPEPWFTENLINGVRINTGGDALLNVPGRFRYTLRYRTTRQLGFFAAHDELYWNAIGTGWDFAIARAEVEVRLPHAVPPEQMRAEAYTGPQGAQGQAYTARIVSPGVAHWTLTQALQAREGLTIVLGFPKGVVAEPSTKQRLAWLLLDNRGILVALAGLLILIVYCVRRWLQVGRDPAPGVIIARYAPPPGRSPAELRYLRRGRYDMRCFTSDLLTSAVEGKVLIGREDRLLLKDRWRLEPIAGPEGDEGLVTASALLSSLFADGNAPIELTPESAPQLMKARKAHADALDKRLKGSHFNHNRDSVTVAFGIAVVSAGLALVISGGAGMAAIVPVCILMLVVVLVFRRQIKAPTPEGRRLIDEAEGLKLYLSVAERDELKNLSGPEGPPQLDAQRYESLLPYAIALDVEDAWTRKFTAAVGAAAAAAAGAGIAWYRGGGINDLGGLATAVGNGLNASIASASAPPGSTSGGGGGGSSGGGGGGGGGGGR